MRLLKIKNWQTEIKLHEKNKNYKRNLGFLPVNFIGFGIFPNFKTGKPAI